MHPSPSLLTLVLDLAEAIAREDPERTFTAGQALARRIGDAAAAAVARALCDEVYPLAATLAWYEQPSCA